MGVGGHLQCESWASQKHKMSLKVTVSFCHQCHNTSLVTTSSARPCAQYPAMALSLECKTHIPAVAPEPIWSLLTVRDSPPLVLPDLTNLLPASDTRPQSETSLFPLHTMSFPSENPLTYVLNCLRLLVKHHLLINTGSDSPSQTCVGLC